ncbi:hypothetical protein AAG570_000710 [Ranatra chinensis]|uniref:Aminoacyl tRNA synthase complex-interacting multifunctional protein 2 n=1 Tax=Ranatra chinensis TaxID=642074 RepID=A0ABD0YXV2_9HEMI
MNEPLTSMYKMKPLFDLGGDIHIQTTMYGMKNLQSGSQNGVCPEAEYSERDFLIKEIENKQAEILKALAGIRSQMAALKEALCKDFTHNGHQGSPVAPRKLDFSEVSFSWFCYRPPSWRHMSSPDGGEVDYPHSLASLCVALSAPLFLAVRPYDSEFIISPFKCVPLWGEVNMLRFISRCVTPSPNDLKKKMEVEVILDICYWLRRATTGKEVYAHVKTLSQILGDSKWFDGEEVSVVDLAAWSAIKSSENPKLSKNLTRWFQQCEELFCTS